MFYFSRNKSIINKKIFKIIILSKVSLFSSSTQNPLENLFVKGQKIQLKPREIKATKKTIIPPNNSEQEIFFIQKSPQGIEKIKNPFFDEIEKSEQEIFSFKNLLKE